MLLKLAESIQEALSKDPKNVEVFWNGHNSLTTELLNVAFDFPESPSDFKLSIVEPKKLYKSVVLVSGGMDSCIMWWLTRDNPDRLALFIDYGQPYADKEFNSLLDQGIAPLRVSYPLTISKGWDHIIPARNLTLIAIAEQFVKHDGELWIGVVSGEARQDAGDKSKLFFQLICNFIWRTKQKFVEIKTLEEFTKNVWLQKYLDATQDLSILKTVTCFSGGNGHCGKCQACVRKWIALRYNGFSTESYFNKDPFTYGAKYIQRYIDVFQECLSSGDFSHYSEARCEQDLAVILKYIYEEKK